MKRSFFCACCFVLLSLQTLVVADATKDVFSKYPNRYFVETGTFYGDGIQKALDVGFKEVYSIELSPKYHAIGKTRFANQNNVHLVQGDSGKTLGQVIAPLCEPITFWLDGHWAALDTAVGESNTPLLAELEWIKNHPIKTHTIMIDDIRCLGTAVFDKLRLEQVVKKIKEINPNYAYRFEHGYQANDILVAYIPR